MRVYFSPIRGYDHIKFLQARACLSHRENLSQLGNRGVMSLNSIPIRVPKRILFMSFHCQMLLGIKTPPLLCKSKVMAVLTGARYRKFDYQSGGTLD